MNVKMMSKALVKSKERLKAHGECFTPKSLVIRMLRQIPLEIWTDHTKTFIDNSCGTGNFIVEVVKLKIKMGSTPEQALSTTYGCELMLDNVEECRERLLRAAEKISGLKREQSWIDIVQKNIVCHDALTYDYSFE